MPRTKQTADGVSTSINWVQAALDAPYTSEHGYHAGRLDPSLHQPKISLVAVGFCFFVCSEDDDGPIFCGHRTHPGPGVMANHLRETHGLHPVVPSSSTSVEHKDGLLAIDHLVVSGDWAAARFLHEPNEVDVRCSRVGRVAERLQGLTNSNAEIAALLQGREFSRPKSQD
ncbi:hypothetical protein S7711_11506 [Stachybotrys chartarum IBT 7711]|uniref:Uncharacterized protein n=1 Tax=Stachybotrys chartarum (strain CBS 109288 / IBT 7711) TaxID=1280523 RepID=A0A084ALC8_STACB|nr:hypothetical protein S7711_11506 [Stachybotrys chartarum IBT 7711]